MNLSAIPHRRRERDTISVAGPLLLAGIAALTMVALFAAIGPTKSVAVVLGLIMFLAIYQWPIIALVMVVLSGTCLQILGDEHLTGLPLSLGKMFGLLALGIWLLTSIRDRIPWTYSPQMVALGAYVCGMIVVGLLVHPAEPSAENGFTRFIQVGVVFWLMANLGGTDRRALLIATASLTAGLALSGVIGTLEHFVPSLSVESDDPTLRDPRPRTRHGISRRSCQPCGGCGRSSRISA